MTEPRGQDNTSESQEDSGGVFSVVENDRRPGDEDTPLKQVYSSKADNADQINRNVRDTGDSHQRVIKDVTINNSDEEQQDGVLGELKRTLFGKNRKQSRKSREQEQPITVHINALYINTPPPPPPPPSVRLPDPVYYGSPPPPEPCGPLNHQYASEAAHVFQASQGSYFFVPRDPSEHGLSAPAMMIHMDRASSQANRSTTTNNQWDIPQENQREQSGNQSMASETSSGLGYAKISKANAAKVSAKESKDVTQTEYNIETKPNSPIINLSTPTARPQAQEAFDTRRQGPVNTVWQHHLRGLEEEGNTHIRKGQRHTQSMTLPPPTTAGTNEFFVKQDRRMAPKGHYNEPEYVNWSRPFTSEQPYRMADSTGDLTAEQRAEPMQTVRGWHTTENISSNPRQNTGDRRMIHRPLPSKQTADICKGFHCVAEGLHENILDDNEKAEIKYWLLRTGKLGQWALLRLKDYPLQDFILEVRAENCVSSFPVVYSKNRNFKIDTLRKGFKCLCKLIKYYQTNKLPKSKLNLGQAFPKSNIPPIETEADSVDDVRRQFAGVRL